MQPRFDLPAAIESWRQELLAQPGLTPDDRREELTHLCETIGELRDRGLDAGESFCLARGCVGPALESPISLPKPDPARVWRERLFWMAIALLVKTVWGMKVAPSLVPMWNHIPHPRWLEPAFVFYDLPLFCLAIFLSRGRFAQRLSWLCRIINSRFRLILISAILVLPWHLAIWMPGAPLYWIVAQYLSQSLIDFFLIASAAWFMPAQYRRAEDRPDRHARHPLQTMEAYGRFDMADAIETWRSELFANPQLTPADRLKAQTHLRDTIAELRDRGLDAEESFWLARVCAGPPRKIAVEYLNADPGTVWRDRVFWMAVAVLLMMIWTQLASMGAYAFAGLAFRNHYFRYSVYYDITPLLYFEGVYYLFACLPPLCLAALLAHGRASRLASWLGRMVDSRGRLMLFTIATICVLHVCTKATFEHKYSLWELKPTLWDIALIVLVAWLMPAQYRKTPKPA